MFRRTKALDEEDSVKVVEFMLDRTGVKVAHLLFNDAAVQVLSPDGDRFMAANVTADLWEGEATLFVDNLA